MLRYVLGFFILTCLNSAAFADRYEVIPRFSFKLNVPAEIRYTAFILDNTANLVVGCDVIVRNKAISSFKCEKRTVPYAIASSADLKSVPQSYQPPAGFSELPWWQINSSTGDLQFCLMAELPTGSCVMIDWKNVP